MVTWQMAFLPRYGDLNHNWVSLQRCVHLVWVTVSLLPEDGWALLLPLQPVDVLLDFFIPHIFLKTRLTIIFFVIHQYSCKIYLFVRNVKKTLFFPLCGTGGRSSDRPNKISLIVSIRHPKLNERVMWACNFAHWCVCCTHGCLLCVRSALQRACFCASTDDAAGRSMTIAGSASTLAHLQKALAPQVTLYIGCIKAARPSAVWPVRSCNRRDVE